jgi:NodT family efflux transporter outer membrane factor (OMF) lipoprotein
MTNHLFLTRKSCQISLAVLTLTLLSSCAVPLDLTAEVSGESAKPQKLSQDLSTNPMSQSAQSAFTRSPLNLDTANSALSETAGESQHFEWDQKIPKDWWTLFGSTPLNNLVQQSLSNNSSLNAARASLQQAQSNFQATYAGLAFPNVSAQYSPNRERMSQTTSNVPGGVVTDLYNTSVNVSYTIDLFGANKSSIASQASLAQYQIYQYRAAQLALTGNVMTAAIKQSALKEQIKETKDILSLQVKQLEIMEKQLNLGAIGASSVLAQRTLVAQTRASLPSLEKALDQLNNQLSILVGAMPNQFDWNALSLSELHLPQKLPLSLPSNLIRHRPDILASEAVMNQNIALLGLAKANLYPQINLNANLGSIATTTSNYFSTPFSFWTVGAGLTAPIFNAGALDSKVKAARAGYESAFYQYKNTVLTAFSNVADSIKAIDLDAQTLKLQSEAEQIAKQNLTISQEQYKLGGINFMSLLDAQKNYALARINLVNAQSNRFADTVALFQSMGGDEWNPNENISMSEKVARPQDAKP